jgi:ribonuclease-3
LADLAALQQSLGIIFNDQSLLEQALVHSSYINENPGFALESNERLEFLGDAVLGHIIAEKLYEQFPHLTEGQMTRHRAMLVRRDSLASIARVIKLGNYLYLGKGEEANGGRNKPANLASVLEAVIAAISIDQGLLPTRDFISRLFDKKLVDLVSQGTEIDYKSRLQEIVQAWQQITPDYELVEITGPDHDRLFTIQVRIGSRTLGTGSGKSKKKAEMEAARRALEQLEQSD